MKSQTSSMHAIMDHVEEIFLISGRHIKYFTLVITGQAFLRMLPSTLKDVIIVKEWVDPLYQTKFLYNLRS